MPTGTLIVAGGMSIGVGLSFAAVARAIGRRLGDRETRLAQMSFMAWWGGLAVYLVLHGGLTVAAAFHSVSPQVYLATRLVNIPALCVAIWGITSFLLYLYVGARQVFAASAVFIGSVAILFFWATFTGSTEVQVRTWMVGVEDSGPAYRFVYLVLGLPPIAAALGYLGLLRRVTTRSQRYRIALVSGSILAYVGSGLAARLSAGDAAVFVTLVVVGSLAAAAALLAYHPPVPVQRWIDQTGPRPENDRPSLQERAQQLV